MGFRRAGYGEGKKEGGVRGRKEEGGVEGWEEAGQGGRMGRRRVGRGMGGRMARKGGFLITYFLLNNVLLSCIVK